MFTLKTLISEVAIIIDGSFSVGRASDGRRRRRCRQRRRKKDNLIETALFGLLDQMLNMTDWRQKKKAFEAAPFGRLDQMLRAIV